MLDKDLVRSANPIEQVIADQTHQQLKQSRPGELKGLCFGHDDHDASLRVDVGKQLYYCDVCDDGGDVIKFVERFQKTDFKSALGWLADRANIANGNGNGSGKHKTISAVYPYRDESGAVLYETVRYIPKNFKQRRPDGKGGHTWNLSGVRRVLYRLNELKGKQAVIVVEGEKDADVLWSLGLPATTNVNGAGKWADEYAQQLKAASVQRVVVPPDNDEPGRQHARAVAASCHAAGLDVRICHLPDVPLKGDVSVYLQNHTKDDLLALIKVAPHFTPEDNLEVQSSGAPTEAGTFILDGAPEEIARPMTLLNGRGFATTWVHVNGGGERQVVIRDDGKLYDDVPRDAQPICKAETLQSLVGVTVRLPATIAPTVRWSGRGVNAYISGHRPSPTTLFHNLIGIIDHFVQFVRSLGPQTEMCALLACYILHTYMLDASNVAGYLWFSGERGSGKTQALKLTASLGHLGTQLLAGSSLPTLRDLSDAGGLIALDDAENVTDPDKFDEDKRALFLSGNQRGSYIAVKEAVGKAGNKWQTRYLNTFGPRIFSSIRQPDATLASRCIAIPMCRAAANLPDPADLDCWPQSRTGLIDDLWAVGLQHLARIREHDRQIVQQTSLVGRTLQPWRGVLTVAWWLERDGGVDGLFDRMNALATSYQHEREDLEADDPVRVAIRGLERLMSEKGGSALTFQSRELSKAMNDIAKEGDFAPDGDRDFVATRRVGKILSNLRVERASRTNKGRPWLLRPRLLEELAARHGVSLHEVKGDAFVV